MDGSDPRAVGRALEDTQPLDLRELRSPEVGPQTAAINLNLLNGVQSSLYRSPDTQRAFAELEESLLGERPRMTRREAAAAGGLSLANARRAWRSLGFSARADDDVAFTTADAQALQRISRLVADDVLSEEGMLTVLRSLGQMMDRMVVWQVEALVEDAIQSQGTDDAQARRELLRRLPQLQEDIEQLVLYSWRRLMNSAVQRLGNRQGAGGASFGQVGDSSATLPLARGIGFADMVSYTSLSRSMDEQHLAKLVQRFENRCAEVISVGGGRLIKTIGDEVMYMSESPEDGARIALGLAKAIREDDSLPRTRVGFVWGRVLPRLGDLYGPTVNLAARLVALTEPGGVLVDASTAAVLAGDDRFILTPQPTRSVHGFGDVQPVALSAGRGPLLEVDDE